MDLRKGSLPWAVVVAVSFACLSMVWEAWSVPTNPDEVDRPIRGKVLDAETEKPIREFTVLLSPPVRDYYVDPRSPEFKITAHYLFRSKSGEFQITDFAGEACCMVVKADGHIHGIVWDYVIHGPKQSKLSELWTEQPLVFRLRLGGLIRGRVMEADSKSPVPEATVVLNESFEADRHKLPDGIAKGYLAETQTDADGAFALDGIAFKTYRGHRLRVTHPRFLAKEVRGLKINGEQPEIKVKVRLEPAAVVSGLVLDSAGTPVESTNVVASVRGKIAVLQSKSFVNFATTDENGHFEVGSLPEGVCSVSAMFSRPGVVSMLGFADHVQLKKGTITEVNLRPIKDAATLFIKVVEERPAFVFVCTSPVGKQAYGLLNAEDARLFTLGIDCIAPAMFYQGFPDVLYIKEMKPTETKLVAPFLSPAAGDLPGEESRTFGTCKIQNLPSLPSGTFFVHAGAMSEGGTELLVGGTSVNLTAGKTTEVTIDLSSAAKHPRKPLEGDPEELFKRMENWQEQPELKKPGGR